MKNEIKKKTKKFEQSNDIQKGRRETKISFLRRKIASIKLLGNPTILAAKVVTFNEGSNIPGYNFATI